MEINELLAKWQGLNTCIHNWEEQWCDAGSGYTEWICLKCDCDYSLPDASVRYDRCKPPEANFKDYFNDATACDSLLDTLVEKGYDPALIYYRGTSAWHMQIFDGEVNAMYPQKPTRREAIIAACLEVARKELNHVD